ncbi:MAG: HAD family hydrolase [Bacteroidota bacterium]
MNISAREIRAVFFDMGGTLEDLQYDRQMRLEACRDLRVELAARDLELGLTAEELFGVIEAGMSAYKDWALDGMVEATPEDIWSEWLLPEPHAPRAKVRELGEFLTFFWENRFYARRLRPGAVETIRTLKSQGLAVGVISNTQSRTQVLVNLEKYRLADVVYPVLLSCLFGRRKPHPSIFLEAAKLAGVDPADVVYVGDTYSRDILGAYQAGYRGSIFIRSQLSDRFDPDRFPPEIARNFAIVESLGEIPALLDGFARESGA